MTIIPGAIAYLIRYPEVQKKIQDELDQFVGENRVITVSDKINLPYTNATIMACLDSLKFCKLCL